MDDNEEQVDGEFSADSEFDDVADAFESSYNFRFEEPCVVSCLRYDSRLKCFL